MAECLVCGALVDSTGVALRQFSEHDQCNCGNHGTAREQILSVQLSVARARLAMMESALEWTLRFFEGLQKATPQEIEAWLKEARAAIGRLPAERERRSK